MKLIDLTGQVFGEWRVIERAGSRGTQPMWLCRCSCANQTEKELLGYVLRHGKSNSCGCQSYLEQRGRVFIDLTGQVFGQWTVIQQATKGTNNSSRWLCRCSCGKEKALYTSNLRRGGTRSCGHDRGNGSITGDGYRILYKPNHPNAKRNGQVLEHQLVMSEMLGRPLLPGENVHHKNLQRLDNRPENLELWYSPPRKGARVEDLIDYITECHPAPVIEHLIKHHPDVIQNVLEDRRLSCLN